MTREEQFHFEVTERAAIIAEKEGEYTEQQIQEMATKFTVAAWFQKDQETNQGDKNK